MISNTLSKNTLHPRYVEKENAISKKIAFTEQIASFQMGLNEYIVDYYEFLNFYKIPKIKELTLDYEFKGLHATEKPIKDLDIDKINALLGTIFAGKLPGPNNNIHTTNQKSLSLFQIRLKKKKIINEFLLNLFFDIIERSKSLFEPSIKQHSEKTYIQWRIPASSLSSIKQLLATYFKEISAEIIDNNLIFLITLELENYNIDSEKFIFLFCFKKFQSKQIDLNNIIHEKKNNNKSKTIVSQKRNAIFQDEDSFLKKNRTY